MIRAKLVANEAGTDEQDSGRSRNLMLMVGSAVALLVLVVGGLVFFFLSQPTPKQPQVHMTLPLKEAILAKDPVRALQGAFTKHTVIAVSVVVVVALVLVAVVVGVVLMRQTPVLPPAPPKELEWNELLLQDPKFAILGVVGVLAVIGVVAGIGKGIHHFAKPNLEQMCAQKLQADYTELFNHADYTPYAKVNEDYAVEVQAFVDTLKTESIVAEWLSVDLGDNSFYYVTQLPLKDLFKILVREAKTRAINQCLYVPENVDGRSILRSVQAVLNNPNLEQKLLQLQSFIATLAQIKGT